MTVYSRVITSDVGSMGDRKYAFGTFWISGVGLSGWIEVPMGSVDNMWLEDIVPLGSGCSYYASGTTMIYGIGFPYSSGTTPITRVPIIMCASGHHSGIWGAFGKRG